MLSDELDSPNRHESANCNLEAITRKSVVAQANNSDLVTESHRSSVSSYDFISCNANRALAEVSKRLKKAFDREARSSRQGGHDAEQNAAKRT